MNTKKVIKKIAAVATGALLVSSAFAATLSEWPQPFVTEDGQGDVQFVIGDGSTSDYLGAIDIAIALQAAAVSETSVDVGGATEVMVEGGYDVSESDSLFLGDGINASKTVYDETELPALLAEGEIEHDGDDFEYNQQLTLSENKIEFVTEDKEPMLRIDLEDSNNLWTYKLVLEDALNMTDLTESFSIEMMGKTFTVPADQSDVASDELKLFGSDSTLVLELNQPVTVESDGTSYTVEVISDVKDVSNTIVVNVNGELAQIAKGKSKTIAGLDIYAEEVFISEVPTLSVSAEIFVGSNEYILGKSKVKIDDETVTGLKSTIATKDSKLALEVSFDPAALDEDIAGAVEVEYLLVGDSVMDPLFGTIGVQFVGPNYEMMDSAKAAIEITSSDDEVSLVVETEEGSVDLILSTVTGTTGTAYGDDSENDGFVSSNVDMTVGDIFLLNDDNNGDVTTLFYKIESFDDEDGIEITNLATGKVSTIDFAVGSTTVSESIGDTTDTFTDINVSAEKATVSNSVELIYLKGGKQTLDISDLDALVLSELEVSSDLGIGNMADFDITFNDGSSDDVGIFVTNNTVFQQSATSKDDDTQNILTEAGTYIVRDTDDDNNYVNIYVPVDEDATVEYTVILAADGAKVITSGGASNVVSQKVNAFAVGAAVLDINAKLSDPSSNLIVIGGTCINSVAAELKEVAASSCGDASGLSPNEAIVELFDLTNNKVAMLIAGYSAVDTQAAARAVALGDSRLTGTEAKLTVSSASNFQIE